jgi:pilus assembly protein Flp/PilA
VRPENQHLTLEGSRMRLAFFTLIDRLQCLIKQEDGQDLVEYALVVALIAFAATAGMKTLASGINTAFIHLNTTVGNYTV